MKNEEIDISIVIPVYKVDDSLFTKCLRSIGKITGYNLETIVVADGEPEQSTVDVVKKMQAESSFPISLYTIGFGGVSAARNYGIEKASGRWIFFLDADDQVINDGFAASKPYVENESEDLIILDYLISSKEASTRHKYKEEDRENPRQDELIKDILNPQSGVGFVWGKLYRRSWLEEHKIRFCETMTMAEDAHFVLNAVLADPRVLYLQEVSYSYWRNENSAVHKYRKDYAKLYIHGMEQIKRLLQSHNKYEAMEKAFAGCAVYHLLLIAVNDSFHPDNPLGSREKRKKFKELTELELFHDAIKKADISGFSMTRKVTVWCIRLHAYFLVQIIAWIRHRQFR